MPRARPRRERSHRGCGPIVAQIIEENAAGAYALRHVDNVSPRTVRRHPRAELPRKGLHQLPVERAAAGLGKGCHHVQTLAPGRLEEALEAQLLEPLTQLARRLDHRFQPHVRRGIEIKHQPAGHFRPTGNAVPRMQLQRGDLRQRGESIDTIDLEIRLAVPRDPRKADQAREAAHGVALEESLAADTIRAADQGAGSTLDVRQHPLADRREIVGEFALGDGTAIARIRPDHFVGVGDRHSGGSQARGRGDGAAARRLRGVAEVPFAAMSRVSPVRHELP